MSDLQAHLRIAKRHANVALVAAFQNDDKPREDLITTAIESLEEAMDPLFTKDELREVMESEPNA